MRRIACTLVVTATAAALPSQQLVPIGPNDDYVGTSVRTWPAGVVRVGDFVHCLAGRFTGHGIPDVVLLDGDQPVLATAPDVHNTIAPLAGLGTDTATNDLALLAGAGGGPLGDGLLLVGPAGLRLWSRTVNATIQVASVPAPAFVGALQLATHPLDPSVVFGLAADACTVRVVDVGPGGLTQSPAVIQVAGGSGSPPILAMVAVDWDDDAAADVAVLTADGLSVFDRSGVQLAACPYAVAAGDYVNPRRSLATVSYNGQTGPGRECVAWLAPKGAGSCLLVRGAEMTNDLDAVDLGAVQFAGIAAADWSLDGQDDLLLMHADGTAADLLVNANGLVPSLFAPTFGFRIAIAAGQPTRAPVATGDLDGDGDADLVAVGGVAGGPTSLVLVCSKPFDTANLEAFEGQGTLEGAELVLQFGFPAPAVPSTFTSPSPSVEAVVWAVDAATGILAPEPLDRCIVDLRVPTTPVTFRVPQAAQTIALMLRAVELDSEGNVCAVGKAYRALILVPGNGGGVIIPGIIPLPNLPPAPPDPPLPPSII